MGKSIVGTLGGVDYLLSTGCGTADPSSPLSKISLFMVSVPVEANLRFLPDGTLRVVMRRDKKGEGCPETSPTEIFGDALRFKAER